MADSSWYGSDGLIGKLLDSYTQIETAKFGTRLNGTEPLQNSWNVPSQPTQPQAAGQGYTATGAGGGMPNWGLIAVLAVGAVIAVAVVK